MRNGFIRKTIEFRREAEKEARTYRRPVFILPEINPIRSTTLLCAVTRTSRHTFSTLGHRDRREAISTATATAELQSKVFEWRFGCRGRRECAEPVGM
jgi:hypothetical protein